MKIKQLNDHTHGFTLIELLIVIALLGALAIGLLAAIDPFEQLKKGRDTSARNTVSEFYNANLRYYSVRGEFPWGTGGTSGYVNTMTADVISTLVTAGELKNRFAQLAGTSNLAKIYVNSTSAENMQVCFRPESKSFQIDPNTIYAADGSTAANCISQVGQTGSPCYYCIL
jgi:prepilin-type N-terminal cleavage/methylation domain-containing protein